MFAALPELLPQRIGRRQAAPVRSGYRAPPPGAEALFGDYDRIPPPPAPAMPRGEIQVTEQLEAGDGTRTATRRAITAVVWDEESSRAKDAFRTPPYGTPVVAPGGPPVSRSAPGGPPFM